MNRQRLRAIAVVASLLAIAVWWWTRPSDPESTKLASPELDPRGLVRDQLRQAERSAFAVPVVTVDEGSSSGPPEDLVCQYPTLAMPIRVEVTLPPIPGRDDGDPQRPRRLETALRETEAGGVIVPGTQERLVSQLTPMEGTSSDFLTGHSALASGKVSPTFSVWRLVDGHGRNLLVEPPKGEDGCPTLVSDERERAAVELENPGAVDVHVQGCGVAVDVPSGSSVDVDIAPDACVLRRFVVVSRGPILSESLEATSIEVHAAEGSWQQIDVAVDAGSWGLDVVLSSNGWWVMEAPPSACSPFDRVRRAALENAVLLSFDGVSLERSVADLRQTARELPSLFLPDRGARATFEFLLPKTGDVVSLRGTACSLDEHQPIRPSAMLVPSDPGFDEWIVHACPSLSKPVPSPREVADRIGVDTAAARIVVSARVKERRHLTDLHIDCEQVKRDMAPWGDQVDWGLPAE